MENVCNVECHVPRVQQGRERRENEDRDPELQRYLRKKLSTKDFRSFIAVYYPMITLDKDERKKVRYGERPIIRDLTNKCVFYAKKNRHIVSEIMQLLRNLDLIDYGVLRNGGVTVIGSWLDILEFKGEKFHEEYEKNAKKGKQCCPTCKKMLSPNVSHESYKENSAKNYFDELGTAESAYSGTLQSAYSGTGLKKNYNIKLLKPLGENNNFSSKRKLKLNYARISHKPDGLCVESPAGTPSNNSSKSSSLSNESLLPKKAQSHDPRELLGKWLMYDLRVHDAYLERHIFKMRNQIAKKKIKPDVDAVLDVLEYWNELAFGFRNNGKRLPGHRIADSKVINLCQIAITNLTQVKKHTVEEIKNAIDNYIWILENSPWYSKNIYNLPQFLTRDNLYDNCFNDNVKGNPKYIPFTKSRDNMTKKQLLDIAMAKFEREEGRKPSDNEVAVMQYDIKYELEMRNQKPN